MSVSDPSFPGLVLTSFPDDRIVRGLRHEQKRKRELKKELAASKLKIREDEEKLRTMLTREARLLDAFDEAEAVGGGASLEVPLDDGLVAAFSGVDEGHWDMFSDLAAECGFGLDGGVIAGDVSGGTAVQQSGNATGV